VTIKKQLKTLSMPGTDPYTNLATEDYILSTFTEDDYLLFWRNDNTIVVGLHQNTQEEINTAFVDANNIRVVRRRTGGGAVYHDLGNLNFSFITDARDAARITMERFTLPIVRGLADMGLQAETSGRNDILINGSKISGNAQCLHKNRILHHGTLLFDSDLSVLSKALNVKPEKFLSKSVKSVRARVGNIKDFLPGPMSMENFSEHLLQSLTNYSLAQNVKAETLELSAQDINAIKELRASKYAAWEWIYGRSPDFNFKNIQKYSGGFLEALLDIKDGHIKNCKFFGDFMALRPAALVAEKLLGVKYTREDVADILKQLPLTEFFDTISLNEILNCMFD
jgi:lipoate-protein ligase A